MPRLEGWPPASWFETREDALLTMRDFYLSSHTSSKRRLLYWLLSCGLKFFT
jgi:hypothetical protein